MTRVHFENRSGIGLLTLDSPETLNSLSSDFLGEIRQAVESLPALDVLIITGVGKSFVAGANIKEMEARLALYRAGKPYIEVPAKR